jgi:hypothetical protein
VVSPSPLVYVPAHKSKLMYDLYTRSPALRKACYVPNWIYSPAKLDRGGGGGIEKKIQQPGTRSGSADSTMLRPVYLRQSPGIPYTGGWVKIGAILEDTENLVPAGILSRIDCKQVLN